MSQNKLVTNKLKIGEHFIGLHPIQYGMSVDFFVGEPSPGRSNVLVFIDNDTWYSTNAGLTWEKNPRSIDLRNVDGVIVQTGNRT